MKKYILFDNDGVLVETEHLYFEANVKTLKEFFDLELDFKAYMEIMARGGTAWEIAQNIGIPEDKISIARKQRDVYYQELLQTRDIEIKGIKEILSQLSNNYKMAIITTSRRVDFDLIHKNRGIIDFMDFTLCVEEYKRAKPYPDPYLAGLERFNASKEETIIIEDSQRGLNSAFNAGIDCAIVKNDFTKTHDFSKANYFIDSLKDLKKLLSTL